MKKSGADAEIPAEFYKALARDEEASKHLRAVIRAYWESGSYRERKVPPPAPVALTAQPPAPPQPPRRSGRATAPSAASLIAIANAPIRHRVVTHHPPPPPLPHRNNHVLRRCLSGPHRTTLQTHLASVMKI